MSAPKTNLEKQKRRHIGPILGITLALVFAGLLLLWFLGSVLVEEPVDTEAASPTDVPEAVIDPVSPDDSPAIEEGDPAD